MIELNEFNRLKALRYLLSAALLVGIFLSRELWFPSNRSFPRLPFLIALPEAVVVPVERLLCVILSGALILTPLVRRPNSVSAIAVASLGLLIFFDQTRLQPWVYQYLLLLGALTLQSEQTKDGPSPNHTLGQLQIVVAALYIWSGAQKLNFSFSHEVLPKLLAPLQSVLSAAHTPLVTIGIGVALVETLIGCGLLFRRTRELCVWLAVAMHGIILVLLMIRSYNSVVWPWNAALALIVVALFRRSKTAPWQTLRTWSANTTTRLAQAGVIASALMPILSFWGWWDMCLSGALYSGNTAVAVVRINEATYKKLPRTAQQQVFMTKSDGRQVLPLFEWSMAELNVPPYPEPRIFRQLTSQVCKLAEGDNEIELVMKERPTILNGSYQVTRVGCAQLER